MFLKIFCTKYFNIILRSKKKEKNSRSIAINFNIHDDNQMIFINIPALQNTINAAQSSISKKEKNSGKRISINESVRG